MERVVVLNITGELLPMMKYRRALIKVANKEAEIVHNDPLTIRLLYKVEVENEQ